MSTTLIRIASFTVAALFLAGCASGYQTFYHPEDGVTPEFIAERRAAPAPSTPLVERAAPDNIDSLADSYAKRGYVSIGYSSFNSGTDESDAAAVKQGQLVGADLVLILNPQYTGSTTSSVPITTPTSTTSYTTGSATAYGAGGPVTAYGNATTTTSGSQTTYIPMTVHRSDYNATYFIKQRFVFGAYPRGLSDTERQYLQTNKGVVLSLIVDNSPAYYADVLPGDIIAAIDGVTVSNEDDFYNFLDERKGKAITVTLVRNGQRIDKEVQLNN